MKEMKIEHYKGLQPHTKLRKGQVGEIVFLPGDPARSKEIAKYLEEPKKIAYNREYLTYTGKVHGKKVSVTSTGIGCPSTAIAFEELSQVGAKVFIRVGSAGAVQQDIRLGEVIIADSAVRSDGTSQDYVELGYPAVASIRVVNALIKSAEELKIPYHVGAIRSGDAFYAERMVGRDLPAHYRELNVLALEMESSTIFTLTRLNKLEGGCVLGVVNVKGGMDYFSGEKKVEELAKQSIINAIKVATNSVKYL
jgi:uridine phosphorylase